MRNRDREAADQDLCELFGEIEQLADSAEIPALVTKMLDIYGLKTLAYLGAGVSDRHTEGPYLAVTYSSEWIERYKAERFIEVDPAIRVGLHRMLPIDWSEFDRKDGRVRRLFGEAGEFGLGRHGVSLPVHGRHGDRAIVSITSDATDRDWRHLRLHYIRDFQLLALHMHQAILRLEGGGSVEQAALSPRERKCLQWISEGKTNWECAVILGLSERTVRFYLESARHKLSAANTTHAVNKACRASLLSELP
ncbi:LuxR family transcriptional regulator [Mesorhizobium sp. M1406]|uniref:helix-turn-helix transcriptional regulator n=1 Tax=Mesorhizobium sp. M1406 TaxID=2957099 RepID=UPI0033377B3C